MCHPDRLNPAMRAQALHAEFKLGVSGHIGHTQWPSIDGWSQNFFVPEPLLCGMSQLVRITDVSPRDGLQNEARHIPTQDKAELVARLVEARVDEVEVSSFVSAKWIPQLGDAAELFQMVKKVKTDDVVFSALVPNDNGLSQAIDVNSAAGSRIINKVSVFAAASESFSHKNTNGTIDQVLERFAVLIPRAKAEGFLIRGYVSCVIACPFEGPVSPAKVVSVAKRLINLGVDELDYGDTIGAADSPLLTRLLREHIREFGEAHLRDPLRFTLHLHDTFGRAAECARTAFGLGVRSFDSAAAGLGGCPYASTSNTRAPGNIDTATLISALNDAGGTTRVDSVELSVATKFAQSLGKSQTP